MAAAGYKDKEGLTMENNEILMEEESSILTLCDENGNFFALGQVGDYPDGSAIKSIKIFEL